MHNYFRRGPQISDFGVTFNLWAPSARLVDLVIDGEEPVPIEADEKGRYSYFVNGAGAGTRYNFLINKEKNVPDPGSLFQPDDVTEQSEVVDLAAMQAKRPKFKGRPWAEAVIYELHVGTFTPEGTYAGVERKLDYLAGLGITAIELMPLNDVPGRRNWGYDGVLLDAPNAAYGRPADLMHLIDAAHERNLMVYLDVVYNHFGPAENHLHDYAENFFSKTHKTDWGPAINLEGEDGRMVRDALIQNALRWLNDYGFDGLRFDAVHALKDDSPIHFLDELAATIRAETPDREVHLMLENENNEAHRLERTDGHIRRYNAQWADDIHNSLAVLLTGEKDGYFSAFADRPFDHLVRSMTECFAYQGETFPLTGEKRGEPSAHLPPDAAIDFLHNHDQIGNRAFGERKASLVSETKLRLGQALILLNPHIPLMFMGDEAGIDSPFLFFTNWEGDLAKAVREGRRKEFENFPNFTMPEMQAMIPDPNDTHTFEASHVDWGQMKRPAHADYLEFTHRLMWARHRHIVPLIKEGIVSAKGEVFGRKSDSEAAVDFTWATRQNSQLRMLANLSEQAVGIPPLAGKCIWNSHDDRKETLSGWLQPRQIVAYVNKAPLGSLTRS